MSVHLVRLPSRPWIMPKVRRKEWYFEKKEAFQGNSEIGCSGEEKRTNAISWSHSCWLRRCGKKKKRFLSSAGSPSKRKIQANDHASPRMKYSELFGAHWGTQASLNGQCSTICEESKQMPRDKGKNHANYESMRNALHETKASQKWNCNEIRK